jgi:hypothetical protein
MSDDCGLTEITFLPERLREQLEDDEATYGVAFVRPLAATFGYERVHPEQVFKSEAGTYTDYLGRQVRLWQSSSEV